MGVFSGASRNSGAKKTVFFSAPSGPRIGNGGFPTREHLRNSRGIIPAALKRRPQSGALEKQLGVSPATDSFFRRACGILATAL